VPCGMITAGRVAWLLHGLLHGLRAALGGGGGHHHHQPLGLHKEFSLHLDDDDWCAGTLEGGSAAP
jgi:hypothetical protein